MAERIEGLSIGLGLDSIGIESGLTEVKRKLSVVNAEMKANLSAFDRSEKSAGKYEAQLDGLNKKLEVQKIAVRNAKDEYERMVKQHGEGSKQADRAAAAYNKEVAAINNLERNVKKLSEEFKDFEKDLEQSESKLGKFSSALEGMGSKMTAVGDKMKNVGINMTAGITAPLVGIGTVAAKTAIDFEAQIDRVGAIAGATAKEVDALTNSAMDLGASTSKSATEVAIAQEGLASMGFTAKEIIGAMPGVISAAESSGADMAQTADVMAASLNIFGFEASEASRVADILAQTANQSAADITDMQYALKYAGSPAASLGVSLEELSASIGIMTDSGMQGEQAGTTLRAALLGLLDPSEQNSKLMDTMGIAITDASGNFVGISQLVENLSTSMEGQTETQKAATLASLVGTEAVSGMLSLMAAGPEKIDKLTGSLEKSEGASAKTAAAMKDNLKGSLDELGGALETAGITVGNILAPAIGALAEKIQSMVQVFQNASPTMQKTIVVFGAIAAAIGPIVTAAGFFIIVLGNLMTVLAPVMAGIAKAGGIVNILRTAFMALTGPVGLTIAGITLLATAFITMYKNSDSLRESMNRTWDGIKNVTAATVAYLQPILASMWEGALVGLQKLGDLTGAAVDKLKEVGVKIGDKLSEGLNGKAQGIVGGFLEQLRAGFSSLGGIVSILAPMVTGIGLSLLGVTGPIGIVISAIVGLVGLLYRLSKSNDEVGTALSNAWQGIQSVFSSAVAAIQPILDVFVQSFGQMAKELAPEFARTIQVIGESFDQLKPAFSELSSTLGMALSELFGTFGQLSTQVVTTLIPAILQLATQVFPLWLNVVKTVFPVLLQVVRSVLPVVINMITALIPIILEIVTMVLPALLSIVQSVFPVVLQVVKTVLPVIATLLKVVIGVVLELVKTVLPLILQVIQAVLPAALQIIQSVIPIIVSLLKGVMMVITTVLVPAIQLILRIVQAVFPVIMSVITNVLKIITNVIKLFVSVLKGDWKAAWDAVKGILTATWNIIKSVIQGALNVIVAVLKAAWNTIRSVTSSVFEGIKSLLSTIWNNIKTSVTKSATGIKDGVVSAWDTLKSKTTEIFSGIKKTLTGLWDDIVGGAKKLPGRIGDGLKQMANDVGKGVKAIGNKLADGLEKGLNGAISGLNWILEKINVPEIDPVEIKRYEKGTKGSGHPGGLAMVNDAKSSKFKELIQMPNGKVGMFSGRNVVANLPRGTKVLPGEQTHAILKNAIPHYEDGIGDFFSFLDKPKDLLDKLYEKFVPSIDLSGTFGDIAKGGLSYVKDNSLDFIKEKLASVFMGDGWTGEMEKDPHKVGAGSGMGGMMKYVEHWYNQIKDRFGKTNFMGAFNNRNVRGGSSKSMHAYGRAFDIGGSHSTMSKIAEFLRTTASNLQYVIYNKKIAGPGVGKSWRTYNGVNPHTDHVHADFLAEAGGGAGSNVASSVSAWRPFIVRAAAQMKEAVTPAQVQGILAQIDRESDGNPRIFQGKAVNDINMRNGNPARGLLQYIPSTFKNYMVKGHTDILNGFHQLMAFFNNTNWRSDLPYGKRGWGPTGSRKYANGTDFHPGGPAVVNDQKGSLFKELIQLPSGIVGMFEGRNVRANLPKGTKVVPARETKKIMGNAGIPKYATGVGNPSYNLRFTQKPAAKTGPGLSENPAYAIRFTAPVAKTMTYIAKAGDTLSGIAKKFKTTVSDLVKMNKIKNPDLIKIGQKILYGTAAATPGKKPVNNVVKAPVTIPKPDHRSQVAKDIDYLDNKYGKDARYAVVQEEKALTKQLEAIEKERNKKISPILMKAHREHRTLTKKEKETIKKINADYAKKEQAAEKASAAKINEINAASAQERLKQIDDYVARKKEAGQLSLVDEIEVYRESMKYFKKGSAEAIEAEKRLNAAKKVLNDELMQMKDDYLSKVQEVNQRVIDEEKALNKAYEDAVNDRAKSLTGGLFDEVTLPSEETEIDPDELIKRAKDQLYVLNNFDSNLDHLETRGLDKALIEELQAMGPQALDEIKALTAMTDTELNEFQDLRKKIAESARSRAVQENEDLRKKTVTEIQKLHTEAEAELLALNKTFETQVAALKTVVTDGFNPATAQLKEIGKNAVQGMITGMNSLKPELQKATTSLANSIKATLEKAFVIKSPSRWMKNDFMGNVIQGGINGIKDAKTRVVQAASTMADWFKPSLSPVSLPTLQGAPTDAMKLLALAAKQRESAALNGNSNSTLPNVSTQNKQEINVVLNYSGAASREDVMGMVDMIEEELARRTRIKQLMNGVG